MRDIESNKIINATYVYYFKNEIDNKWTSFIWKLKCQIIVYFFIET